MVKATVCKTAPVLCHFAHFHARSSTARSRRADTCLTKPYVSMIENGERKSPSLRVLKRLAKALTVPVTALLD